MRDWLPDLLDLHIYGGLALACYGIGALLGVAVACTVGGAALLWLGVRAPDVPAQRPDGDRIREGG